MIKSYLIVRVPILGDGTSTVFVFDLRKDPITFDLGSQLSPEFDIIKTPPTGVTAVDGGNTASISGYAITLTFGSAPSGFVSPGIYLEF